MYRNKMVIGATFICALLLAMMVLMLPVPDSWTLPASVFYLQLSGYAILTCLHIGAAVLFTMNLDVYKASLRSAYIAIAGGIIITAFGTLQVPVIGALDAWQSAWVEHGGLLAPFFVSSLTLYWATLHLARLIKVKHPLTRVWLFLPLALIVSVSTSLLPHVAVATPETDYDVAVGVITWAALLSLFSAVLVLGIRRHVGAHYTYAMSWLATALFNSFLILAIQLVYTLTANDKGTGLLAQVSTVLAIASGFLWLRAGYSFALTKGYEEDTLLVGSLFRPSHFHAAGKPKTVVDMVTYVAGLVSNTDDIDPLLDGVRAITAKLKPGEAPSEQDTASLVETYLKIEHYLTTKEALRTYSQSEIRSLFDPSLQTTLTTAHKTHKAGA